MKRRTTELKRRSFERIVVLVDVSVFLPQNKSKKQYAASIFFSVERILQLCNGYRNFSTQLGYGFFDSSISPRTFKSRLGEDFEGVPMLEDFDTFPRSLDKFGKVLNLMLENSGQYNPKESRGEHIVNAIKEVLGFYTWTPLLVSESDSSDGGSRGLMKDHSVGDCPRRDSSAIILFSSIPTTWHGANCFFNVPQLVEDNPPAPSAQNVMKKTFENLRKTLTKSSIRMCFIDVPMHQDLWSEERLDTILNPSPARKLMSECLSELAKTVIAAELLVASPKLLPCSITWNTMVDLGVGTSGKRSYGRVLVKEDTPLCYVRWQPLNFRCSSSCNFSATDKLDIIVVSVLPKTSVNMLAASERFLVRQSSRPLGAFEGEDRDTFGDKVLRLLDLDRSTFRLGQPGWQLLLLSLASQDYVCEVDLYNADDGHSTRAILQPFTSSNAIFSVFEKGIIPANINIPDASSGENLPGSNTAAREELGPGDVVNRIKGSRDAASHHKHEGVVVIQSRKRLKLSPLDDLQVDWEREGKILTELTANFGSVLSRYIKGGEASQLLQILDNILKEPKQPSGLNDGSVAEIVPGVDPPSCQAVPDNTATVVRPSIVSGQDSEALKSGDEKMKEVNEQLELLDPEVQKEGDGDVNVDAVVPQQEGDPPPSMGSDMTLEEATEYLSTVGNRIEGFLSSADVDGQRFAEMLIAESQKSLYVTIRHSEDNQQRSAVGDHTRPDLDRRITTKLKRLLLISPKQLLAKYKDRAGPASEIIQSVDEKVKEHELQILLRLEIISFDEGRLLEQKAKDQLVKDVCSLLDTVQFHLDGGIFGGKSLPKYCEGLFASRYKRSIPSTISTILSMMELDGYSEPALLNFGSDMELPAGIVQPTGDLLEAGVSQERLLVLEKNSSKAFRDVPVGSSDAENGDLQRTLEKNGITGLADLRSAQTKKRPHFASYASNLMRKRKSTRRHVSTGSTLSKGRGKRHDSPFKIVIQTPAPVTAPSRRGANEETEKSALAHPMELPALSPTNERVSLEQIPHAVEETPYVRRRLTLNRARKQNRSSSGFALDKLRNHNDSTSNTFANISVACPSKPSRSPCIPEPSTEQGVVGGHCSFTGLLESLLPRPLAMEAVRNFGSNLGNQPPNDSDMDDQEDDDEYVVMSTPFKLNVTDDSNSSIQSFQSDRPAWYKLLDLSADDNTARDGFSGLSLHPSPTMKSTGPFQPADVAKARQLPSFAVDATMSGDGGTSEGTQQHAHHSCFTPNTESNLVTGCIEHQNKSPKDSCPEDVTLGKVTKGAQDLAARRLKSPLGVGSDNSAARTLLKMYPSMEPCSVSDTAAARIPGSNAEAQYASATVHNKENQSTVIKNWSTNSRAGLALPGRGGRKTRSMTQNIARQQVASRKRRKRRMLETSMTRDERSSEGTRQREQPSCVTPNTELNLVTGCMVHQNELRKDSCPNDVTLGKVTKGAASPRSPCGVISNNSASRTLLKMSPSMEPCTVSDTAARRIPESNLKVPDASVTVHNKENQSTVIKNWSTYSRAGLALPGRGGRKTRSMTRPEQNIARQQVASRKRRKRRMR